MSVHVLCGDVLEVLSIIEDDSVDCIVTSPPYFGLRDYGVAGQIGLETTMADYLATMVAVCGGLRRVLKPSGTFWLNVGDSYNSQPGQRKTTDKIGAKQATNGGSNTAPSRNDASLKAKDLMMIPNRLAIALQDDGWYVRSEIIWSKPNPMPESVRDRPTNAHEKVWLLTKRPRYFYDAEAVRNPPSEALLQQVVDGYNGRATKAFGANGAQEASATKSRIIAGARAKMKRARATPPRHAQYENSNRSGLTDVERSIGSNLRNVWTITPKPFKEAHFATFPPELVERCVKAGCPRGGLVLDPFGGSGTTGVVAKRLGRDAILIDLKPEYCEMARRRISEAIAEQQNDQHHDDQKTDQAVAAPAPPVAVSPGAAPRPDAAEQDEKEDDDDNETDGRHGAILQA